MAKIFISYARADGYEHAHEIANQLRALKHEVFLDVQGIPGGVAWDTELTQSIQWCDILLVLMTPISNQSEPVYNEFRAAEVNKKLIIPIQVDDTPFASYLKKYQAIPLKGTNYDAMLLRFVTALSEHEKRATREQPVTISQLKQLEKEKVEPPKRKISPFLFIAIALIAIALIMGIFLVMNNNNNAGSMATDETQVAQNFNESPTLTRFEQLTATAQVRGIPTLTLTRTPYPSYTPRPPTSTPTRTPRPTNTPFYTHLNISSDRILYAEDFESSRASGWVSVDNWLVVDDGDGNMVYRIIGSDWQLTQLRASDSSNWQNYGLRFDVKFISYNNDQPTTFLTFLYDQGYNFATGYSLGLIAPRINNLEFGIMSGINQWTTLFYTSSFSSLTVDNWNNIIIEIDETTINIIVNGLGVASLLHSRFDNGGIAFASGEAEIMIDNIIVYSLDSN